MLYCKKEMNGRLEKDFTKPKKELGESGISMIVEFFKEYYMYVNLFFAFSFLGWIMECIVIRIQTKKFENRGFVKSPFCIIYGFGALLGNFLARPFMDSFIQLYLFGAIAATLFEYFTGCIMIKMFGKIWWDYEDKPYNYRGIVCLESTLGWGIVSIIIFKYLYQALRVGMMFLPEHIGMVTAAVLLFGYATDFSVSMRAAKRNYRVAA